MDLLVLAYCSCSHAWPFEMQHHVAGTYNSGMPWMIDTLRHTVYGKHRSTLADASARAHPRSKAFSITSMLMHVVWEAHCRMGPALNALLCSAHAYLMS